MDELVVPMVPSKMMPWESYKLYCTVQQGKENGEMTTGQVIFVLTMLSDGYFITFPLQLADTNTESDNDNLGLFNWRPQSPFCSLPPVKRYILCSKKVAKHPLCVQKPELLNVQFRWSFLRVLKLDVSVYNVYITNQFQTTSAQLVVQMGA